MSKQARDRKTENAKKYQIDHWWSAVWSKVSLFEMEYAHRKTRCFYCSEWLQICRISLKSGVVHAWVLKSRPLCSFSQLSSSLFSELIPCLVQPARLPSTFSWEWIKRCLSSCGWGNLPACPCALRLGLHESGNCSPVLYRASATVKCKCCALGSHHSCIQNLPSSNDEITLTKKKIF